MEPTAIPSIFPTWKPTLNPTLLPTEFPTNSSVTISSTLPPKVPITNTTKILEKTLGLDTKTVDGINPGELRLFTGNYFQKPFSF